MPAALLNLRIVPLALTLLTAACSAPLHTRSTTATIVSEAGEPVSGAFLRADPVAPRHPLNVGDYLRSDPGRLGVWHTDAEGKTPVTLLSDHPTAVSFAARGFLPASVLVHPWQDGPLTLTLTPLFAGAEPASEERNRP